MEMLRLLILGYQSPKYNKKISHTLIAVALSIWLHRCLRSKILFIVELAIIFK